MKRKAILWLFLLGVIIISAPTMAQVSFQGLGDLPGGGLFSSHANGVSGDGSTVVGQGWGVSDGEAFRWTESGGMVGLGVLPSSGRRDSSSAIGVSADGSVIVGKNSSFEGNQAFIWENGQMTGLGGERANDVSADGSITVGYQDVSNVGYEACYWQDNVITGLGDLTGGGFESYAFGVSADGSVIVGQGESDSGTEAFRWTEITGMVGLGNFEGGLYSRANAASADGSVVVGRGNLKLGSYEAYRWENNVMTGLGDLQGGKFRSEAYDVSADGSVVVGQGTSDLGEEAFIWDSTNGMRNLKDVLVNDYALDLTGWKLRGAHGISHDGLTFVGYGVNPSGWFEAWIATVTELVNSPPVADAGDDQVVYLCADGAAEIELDGSGSTDADGDELTYLWTWTIDANEMTATGVDPNIMLPVGLHTINLTVDDGTEVSEPNSCVIEVIEGIEVDLRVLPRVINRKSRMTRFLAIVQLPAGIDADDIDGSFWLYPGEIEPYFSRLMTVDGSQKLFMVFDKSQLLAAVPDNGPVVLEIEAQLISGRCLYGSDRIRIIRRGQGPREQARLRKNMRFRRTRVQNAP